MLHGLKVAVYNLQLIISRSTRYATRRNTIVEYAPQYYVRELNAVVQH